MSASAPKGESGLRPRFVVAAAVAALAIASDQISKMWALGALEEGRPIPLVGDLLTLQLIRNSGAAFSLGASTTWIFTLLAIVIVAALVVALFKVSSRRSAAAIGLLIGGAIGNLIDRLVQPPAFGRGHVVDFIDYHGFFVGNVADIWIVVAAAWLAFELTREFPAAPADGGGAETLEDVR